jgi:hypothetical protein
LKAHGSEYDIIVFEPISKCHIQVSAIEAHLRQVGKICNFSIGKHLKLPGRGTQNQMRSMIRFCIWKTASAHME